MSNLVVILTCSFGEVPIEAFEQSRVASSSARTPAATKEYLITARSPQGETWGVAFPICPFPDQASRRAERF